MNTKEKLIYQIPNEKSHSNQSNRILFSFVNINLDRAPSEERIRDLSIFPGSLSTDGEGKKTILIVISVS